MPKYRGSSPSQGGLAFGENGDIGRPDHDKIMLWLDAKLRGGWLEAQFPPILESADLARVQKDVLQEHRHEERWKSAANNAELLATLFAEAVKPEIDREPQFSLKWEHPIERGFVDMFAAVERTCLWSELVFISPDRDWRTAQPTIRPRPNRFVTSCYFEVKTDKATIGETIRQINAYKQIVGLSRWWVVRPPSDEWATILPQQGIEFLAYEP